MGVTRSHAKPGWICLAYVISGCCAIEPPFFLFLLPHLHIGPLFRFPFYNGLSFCSPRRPGIRSLYGLCPGHRQHPVSWQPTPEFTSLTKYFSPAWASSFADRPSLPSPVEFVSSIVSCFRNAPVFTRFRSPLLLGLFICLLNRISTNLSFWINLSI